MNIQSESWATTKAQEAFRETLIPTWIKVFGWFFMLRTAIVPLALLIAIVTDYSTTYHLFGASYEGPMTAPIPLLFAAYLMIPGMLAYGLLVGKKWGLIACLVWGYISFGVFLFDVFWGPSSALRLDIIILFFYLRRLHKIRPHW